MPLIRRSQHAASIGSRERGAALIEYALAVALIAVVSIGGVTLLGEKTEDELDCVAIELGSPDIRPRVLRKLHTDINVFTLEEAKFRDSCL